MTGRCLAGDSVAAVKAWPEAEQISNAAGNTAWTAPVIRTILTIEKYCGDVLLQKTFIKDCISKKVIRNNSQLPKYLIQNHHERIVGREQFDAVQEEMTRRRAQTGAARKSAPTGMGKYSSKFALSGLPVCGECGTLYRRVIWTQKGRKRPVRRCAGRLDYGKKCCSHSPSHDEEPLQQTVMAALNRAMSAVHQLVETVKVISKETILVCLKNGQEITQTIQ